MREARPIPGCRSGILQHDHDPPGVRRRRDALGDRQAVPQDLVQEGRRLRREILENPESCLVECIDGDAIVWLFFAKKAAGRCAPAPARASEF